MIWINTRQISDWAKGPVGKAELALLISRLIRATCPLDTFLQFPRGADTYDGGWDGIVESSKKTAFVPPGTSLWEMGTEKGIKGKADRDYEKRKEDPLGQIPASSTFVFVTPHKWTQKKKWVAEKKAEKFWNDVVVYDGVDLEQWLQDPPAVAWWFAVFSGNMPEDAILSAEQSWKEYAASEKIHLSTKVLIGSRKKEAEKVRAFFGDKPSALTIKARSRDEAVAFALAVGMELDKQLSEDFLSRTLVIEDVKSFRTVANNRHRLILIAKFEDISPINIAVTNGHLVILPIGGDDTHSAGNTVVLSHLGRELETALIASGLAPEEAKKLMLESGRDLTILKHLLKFSRARIKWATSEHAPLLLPALFLGRWDDKKAGDVALLETLAGESYSSYIAKLDRWRKDAHPFVYQIGSSWRLASPLDAWVILADYITKNQLDRFETVAISVLGQVKPLFDLPPEKRFMAGWYGKESIYSAWARQGVSHSLILFALFGSALRLPGGDSQKWVNDLIGKLLQTDEPDFWRSLDDIMPLVAEAAPDRFLSSFYTIITLSPHAVREIFQEDPSPVTPHVYYTGLLWALEALGWIPKYLARVTHILAGLAGIDPGGSLSNRPTNSLRGIYLPWKPMTYATTEDRDACLRELVASGTSQQWRILAPLLPRDHDNAYQSHETRWRFFEMETGNDASTYADVFAGYHTVMDLAVHAAGLDEGRLVQLLEASTHQLVQPGDRRRILTHIASIAANVVQTKFEIITFLRDTVHRHRVYSDQRWALPEVILEEYERLIPLFEPKNPIEICKNLFQNGHPHFPEMTALPTMDYKAHEEFILRKRIAAIQAVYAEHGFDEVVALAKTVPEKGYFGNATAHCELSMEEQSRFVCACGLQSSESFNAASSFSAAKCNIGGIEWTKTFYFNLKADGYPIADLGRFLAWIDLSSDLLQFLRQLEEEVRHAYWSRSKPWIGQLSSAEKIESIENLLIVGRGPTAVELVNLYSDAFGTDLIMRSLASAAVNSAQEIRRPQSHEIERLFTVLYDRKDYDRAELAKLEWLCMPMISLLAHPLYNRILQEEIAVEPIFFIWLIKTLYKAENDDTPPIPSTKENQERANQAVTIDLLLHSWHRIPGTAEDGQIDPARLNDWVDEARALAAAKYRLKIADNWIGKVLAYYPNESGRVMPPDFICGIIDRINTPEFIGGFRSAIFNQHSMSSRGPFEGGGRERGMSEQNQKWANALLLKWPITASIFESLASGYQYDAVRHDEEAEKSSLDS